MTKGDNMSKQRYTAEEIINKLREVEVLLSKGQSTDEACRQIGVTEQTYYRWRKEYGGLRNSDADDNHAENYQHELLLSHDIILSRG